MGELDEKETAPANAATATNTPTADVIAVDEPKETETLLPPVNDAKDAVAAAQPSNETVAPAIESPKSTASSTTVTIEKEPTAEESPAVVATEDKEKEKLLPEDAVTEKGKPTSAASDDKAAAASVPAVTKEGREVKPKKIPIGGIKMPGFFTKSKPKNEGDGADGELLEKGEKAAAGDVDVESGVKSAAEEKAEEVKDEVKPTRPGFFASLRLRNPFAKREPEQTNEEDDTVKEVKIEDGNGTNGINEKSAEADETAAAPPPPKKGLLNAIRLPIANMIPKKLRPVNGSAAAAAKNDAQDVELGVSNAGDDSNNTGGGGPHNKAGLASMETLDDSLKDADTNGKDVTDKSATIKADDLETIKLTDAAGEKEKENEAAAGAAANLSKRARTLLESIRAYKCTVDDLAIAGGLLLFVLLVGIICVFTFTGHGEVKSAPLRDGRFVVAYTTCGPVEGIMEDSSFAFRDLPYARSPIGERRWTAADPIQNIENCWNGTLKAHSKEPVTCTRLDAENRVIGQEDCLTLDVVTPHVRYDNPLPVVVMFGVETLVGGEESVLRPSARFARKNDVIFVRPNFRLGTAGFLALKAISANRHPPTSGNYALSDMLAALQWVQLNIAHFGGNPQAVTLLGHRAGATLVSALVTSERAQGLYARAWSTSGAALFPGRLLAESEQENAQHLAVVSACKDLDCLQRLNETALMAALPAAWKRDRSGFGLMGLPGAKEEPSLRHGWLVLDGEILKQHPADVWNREAGAPKLVIGTTMQQAHSAQLREQFDAITGKEGGLREHLESGRIGQLNLTDEVLQLYGESYEGYAQMISDIRTVCPLLTIARVQPSVPFYVVAQPDNKNNVAGGDDDVLAILGRYEPKTPEQRRYVSAIQQLFYHYVSHGEMKQFEPRRRVMIIGQDVLSQEDYPNCNFWISKDVVPRYARLD